MSKIENFFASYKETLTVVLSVIFVATFFFAADGYVTSQIDERITNENYVNRLSKTLRPFCVFNSEGTINYDHGAERFIEKIEVNLKDYGRKIVKITTKEYLQHPPIIIYLGMENYGFIPIRSDTNSWIFKIAEEISLVTEESTNLKVEPQFLMEIRR